MNIEEVTLDVPKTKREEYLKYYMDITRESEKLMLFAGDQKVEHLKEDFYGKGIPKDDENPEQLFEIASKGKKGVFATQLWLIARYDIDFRDALSRENKFED